MEELEKFVLVTHLVLSSHVCHFYLRVLEAYNDRKILGSVSRKSNNKSEQGYEESLSLFQISV
jgi:hypothetical protein